MRFSTISHGSKTLNTILIIGFGDIGQRVASIWLTEGAKVHALSRTPEKLNTPEVTLHQDDLDDACGLNTLPTKEALLYYFAPPPAEGDNDPRVEQLLAGINPGELPQRVVYISTSGVYGDCQGAIVTEETVPRPETGRARRRRAAEQAFLAWGKIHTVPITILRVGGIYGPGRLPIQRIQQGTPILKREEAPYSNRIHAYDLAEICVCAGQQTGPSTIYNTCDGEHSTMSEYFLAVAEAAGLTPPPQISWAETQEQFSPTMLSYLTESRRMDISKLKRELNYQFRYPNLKAGLVACFKPEEKSS